MIKDWQLSNMLTATRVTGEIALIRNGDFIDIWIKDKNNRLQFIAVIKNDLIAALDKLQKQGDKVVIWAESDIK